VIHRGGLTLKSESRLDFPAGGRIPVLLQLLTDKIEHLFLARSKFSHGCSLEHYWKLTDSQAAFASLVLFL
jgi:hypothetical protein